MFKKLKIKFILLSMISLLLLLSAVVAGMNLLNYASVGTEADEVLSILSRNKGHFPNFGGGAPDKLPPGMSPELPYESRYFSVLLNENGSLLEIDTSRISAVDSEDAIGYAEEALKKESTGGFLGEFRYIILSEERETRIIFLDCGRQLDAAERFLLTSIEMALTGYLIVSVAIIVLSGRLVRPVAEGYEKQKRFITDAGHELKTPLTIIGANVDLMELELGEHESLSEIKAQTKRLSTLTSDLVFLAKMEESGSALPMIDFPVSDLVEETATPFGTLAEAQGKTLAVAVTPLLSMHGNAKAIEQLISILLDNALKYSPVGSEITLRLEKNSKGISLSVANASEQPLDDKNLDRLFDRFYRTDPSRNSATGGHGIGLSIAKAITDAHGGKISAASRHTGTLKITAIFPL